MKRITAVAVIAAPALFLVANLIHPKEYTRDHEAQQLTTIADNYTRWQFAHFLTFVAILLPSGGGFGYMKRRHLSFQGRS